MGTLDIYKMQFMHPFYSEGTVEEKGENLNIAFCRAVVFKKSSRVTVAGTFWLWPAHPVNRFHKVVKNIHSARNSCVVKKCIKHKILGLTGLAVISCSDLHQAFDKVDSTRRCFRMVAVSVGVSSGSGLDTLFRKGRRCLSRAHSCRGAQFKTIFVLQLQLIERCGLL